MNKYFVSVVLFGIFVSGLAFAGTGRSLLTCGDGSRITQSEQPLGWPEKPGTPGIHDEYIILRGTEAETNEHLFQNY